MKCWHYLKCFFNLSEISTKPQLVRMTKDIAFQKISTNSIGSGVVSKLTFRGLIMTFHSKIWANSFQYMTNHGVIN